MWPSQEATSLVSVYFDKLICQIAYGIGNSVPHFILIQQLKRLFKRPKKEDPYSALMSWVDIVYEFSQLDDYIEHNNVY